jgi:hypothetical protein
MISCFETKRTIVLFLAAAMAWAAAPEGLQAASKDRTVSALEDFTMVRHG